MEKYSDKYINSFDILNNAVVGFEFEFYTDRPYHKLLELLNRELAPIKVSGYRIYHSSFKPTPEHWKIEADLSLGPSGVELISGPLPYVNAKVYLLKVLKILQGKEFKTDDKCSIHINISFDKDKSPKTLDKLNRLKLILNMDEDLVYKYFPDRENNFYAKSIKKIIPFKNFHFSNDAANLLEHNLELPDTKYYGVNFLHMEEGRLEFRYIGDKDYQFKTAEILDLMDYFIQLTWNCTLEPLDEEDMDELKDYLSDNLNQFKNFSRLENFIAEFPSIMLQVDLNDNMVILRTYYEQLYDDLYELITNIYNLNNCIINYNTENQRLEIVDAVFKTIFDIKKVDVIDSNIDGGSFVNCNFYNCEIKNVHLNNCTVHYSDIYSSKIENCKIEDDSVVMDCYVFNTYLNAEMKGGVFRSGKLGEDAILDKNVDIVTGVNNYFGRAEDQSREDKLKSIGVVGKINKGKFLGGKKPGGPIPKKTF